MSVADGWRIVSDVNHSIAASAVLDKVLETHDITPLANSLKEFDFSGVVASSMMSFSAA